MKPTRRTIVKSLLLAFSVALSALGISTYYTLGIGTDPVSVFVYGQHNLLGVSLGTVTLLDYALYFLLAWLLLGKKLRQYIGVSTLVNAVLVGPLIDAFCAMLSHVVPPGTSLTLQFSWRAGFVFTPITPDFALRVAVVIAGGVLLGVGVGCYLAVDWGAAPLEAFLLAFAERTRLPLRTTKIAFDAIVTVVGFGMGGPIGVGSVIGIALTGPILARTMHAARRRLERL